MIDLASGAVTIAPGVSIGPDTDEAEFERLTADQRTETGAVTVVGPGGERFLLQAVFREGRLRAVLLAVEDAQLGVSPEEWGLGTELARREWHTRWLRASLGVELPSHHSWGTLDSVYHLLGATSLITVVYGATAAARPA